jgi:hypothetical protein
VTAPLVLLPVSTKAWMLRAHRRAAAEGGGEDGFLEAADSVTLDVEFGAGLQEAHDVAARNDAL